jgi:type II secretory pathway pseudopilin PulG
MLMLLAAASDPVVGLAGVVIGALAAGIAPIIQAVRERSTRADDVKRYKRLVYRNFLDHAYWYRTLPDGDEKHDRHKKYTADWYRIRLISEDQAVRDAVTPLQSPVSITDEIEKHLFTLFTREIGQGGLGD